jgi:hypothetical protein
MADADYQLLPRDLLGAYLEECQRFRENEFGTDVVTPLELTRLFRQKGMDFYSAYGDFNNEPDIKAIAQLLLISESEYALMRSGVRDERELVPWSPADGPAVLWVASILSTVAGGAAHVISGIVSELEIHPHLASIKTIAAFVTGPKGYIFAEACGMKQRAEKYGDGLPFFEMPFDVTALTRAGDILSRAWNIDAVRSKMKEFKAQQGGIVTLRDGQFHS